MTTASTSAPLAGQGERASQIDGLLVAAGVALVLTHWLRLLPLGFAAPGATRYEDFVDLLTPYLVAGPCLVALARAGAAARWWPPALTASALFVQGHALHLAANSISHARGDAAPTRLWDEQIGHALWFSGLAVLAGVVLVALSPLGPPVAHEVRTHVLAGVVGLTWAANVVEAGQVALGVLAAVALAGLAWHRRDGRPVLLACGTAAAALTLYGLWQGGFPQPSELGWL